MATARVSLSADVAGAQRSIGEYARLLGKEPGVALKRHGRNFNMYAADELKKLKPTKQDISLEALRAQRKRKRRTGTKGSAYKFNKIDAQQGKLLGLKIRPSVVSQARAKFGQASQLKKPKAVFGPALPFDRKKGRKNISRQKGRLVSYQGKKLNVTQFMIAREIAVRRSGIGYLSYGINVSKFKKGGPPVAEKVSKFDRYKRFASKVEFVNTPNVAQFRLVGVVPGTLKVGRKRGVYKRGAQRVQGDIKTHLVGKAVALKRGNFKGRRTAKG